MAEQIIPATNAAAKQQIVVLEGEAFVKDARGQLQPIKAGDTLLEGQIIATGATGHLTILLPNGQIIELGADRSLLIDGDLLATSPTDSTEAAIVSNSDSADQIINALNQGKDLSEELEATAAGLNAGAGTDEGNGFVRLMRIAENVDPLSFDFGTTQTEFEPLPELNNASTPIIIADAENQAPNFVDANNSPLGQSQTLATPEDTPISGQLKATDSDGDALVFNKVTDPSNGTVTVQTDGSWTYTPNKDYNGPDSFQVTVSDGKGGTDTLTVDIAVTPVNDAPDAQDDIASTLINTPVENIKVLINDKDVDGDTLIVTKAELTDPSKGSVTINADGSLNFTPATNVLGPVVINYTISDGKGGTDIAQLTVNVGDVATPPIAKIEVGQPGPQDDSVVEGNNLVFNVTLTNASPKAESYDFKLGGGSASTADYGTPTFSNGVTFNPVTGQITVPAGVTSFAVTLPTVDDTIIENAETVPLTIGGVTAIGTILDNDASPTSTGGSVTGTEDTPLTLTWTQFNATDVDTADNSLSIRIATLPSDGKLQYLNGTTWEDVAMNKLVTKADIDLGKLRFVPDLHESGDNNFTSTGVGNQKPDYAQFKYTVFDGNSDSTSATMNIDIAAKADAPTISIGGVTLVDGGSSSTIPKGNGLTVQYFAPNANDGMNTTTARDTSNIESAMESSTATSTTIQTAPDKASVTTDSGYRITGLIYLEAGKTYTFSGSRDDTVLMKIGGTAVLNSPYDNYGNFSATPYKPTTSGYFSYEFVMFNASGVGNFDLNVSVNGAPAIDFNATNFNLYSSLTELEKAGGVHGPLIPVGDGGIYPVGLSGQEDSFIKLSGLSVNLVDKDGSESITAISLSGLKAGSIVTDGTNNYTVPVGNDALNLQGWNLANLSIKPPLNFNGQYDIFVNATSTEGSNNDSASSKVKLSVNVLNSYDAAVAIDDGNTIKEDSTPNPISGNVLTNDQNPDSMALTVSKVNGSTTVTAAGTTVQGEFGTLLIKADGTYSYTLDNSNARVNGLVNGQQLLEKFTYTLSDGTGTSTATLNITINGTSDQVMIYGSELNDQIGIQWGESTSSDDKTYYLQLQSTAIGINSGSTTPLGFGSHFVDTKGSAQVIDAGGGNDYVETGRGNDVIYGGDSDSAGYSLSEIMTHKMITLSTSQLVDPTTQLLSAAVGVSNPKADVINAGTGNDAVFGQSGVDLIYGHDGDDYLDGGSGNDVLRGGLGNDTLRGGSGNDVLRGDAGVDVFMWLPGDQAQNRGATAISNLSGSGYNATDFGITASTKVVANATDVVKDFSTTEGDKLDLRDLLQGENHDANNPNDIGNLLNHLHFEKSGTSTVIHISTAGEFVNGAYDASKEDQTIILQGVDLTAAGSDQAIIQTLLNNKNLLTD